MKYDAKPYYAVFSKMFKIVQFYCYSFRTVSGRIVKVWWTIAVHQYMQKNVRSCELQKF